jgi:hypothetical protein
MKKRINVGADKEWQEVILSEDTVALRRDNLCVYCVQNSENIIKLVSVIPS